MRKKTVLIGFLGPTLDKGNTESRWTKWRPTVAACRQESYMVDRFELIYQEKYSDLKDRIVADINTVSSNTTVVEHSLDFKDAWDFSEVFTKLYEFARSYNFDTTKNDYLIHITTGTHVVQICLFLLTESRHLPGRLLQIGMDKEKSVVGTSKIIDLDLTKYEAIATRFFRESLDSQGFLKEGIETRNKKFNEMIAKIEKVCMRSNDPILLMGETGSGKTALARKIYELKKKKNKTKGKFVEINCATLRGDTAMSTLFGHKKGSFTGALRDREGLLKEADQGLLFLDEIGDLSLDEQAMLLRAIEDKKFLPLGSDKEVTSDFELIAGTNRNLFDQIRKGTFREDLLARINLWSFSLPSLRSRSEDIEPNIFYELEKYSKKTGKKVVFSKEALDKFLQFSLSPEAKWRGNFRDLNGAITRMGTFADSGKITKEIVDEEVESLHAKWEDKECQSVLSKYLSRSQIKNIDIFDRVQLESVVQICLMSKSLSDAGRRLFQASRTKKKSQNDADRLKKYLNKFMITTDDLFN